MQSSCDGGVRVSTEPVGLGCLGELGVGWRGSLGSGCGPRGLCPFLRIRRSLDGSSAVERVT